MIETWLYHATLPAQIFTFSSKTELDEKIAEGWADSPACFTKPSELEKLDKQELIKQADELGIEIDKRWSAEKIQAIINESN